ncbi:MAG: hypothetical protein AVDCRST_MAG60-538, partial [uncultured Nocardioides sp.]
CGRISCRVDMTQMVSTQAGGPGRAARARAATVWASADADSTGY